MKGIEDGLRGRLAKRGEIEELVSNEIAKLDTLSDFRATKWYQGRLLTGLVLRALEPRKGGGA